MAGLGDTGNHRAGHHHHWAGGGPQASQGDRADVVAGLMAARARGRGQAPEHQQLRAARAVQQHLGGQAFYRLHPQARLVAGDQACRVIRVPDRRGQQGLRRVPAGLRAQVARPRGIGGASPGRGLPRVHDVQHGVPQHGFPEGPAQRGGCGR